LEQDVPRFFLPKFILTNDANYLILCELQYRLRIKT